MRWIGASSLSFYNDLPRMNKAHESFLNMLKQIEDELLPIGSVVMFKDWEHPLMVYGRRQMDFETKKTWDYVCCYFPHGNISSEYNFFLNHEDISSVLHLGFINETELEFQKLFKKEIEEKQ